MGMIPTRYATALLSFASESKQADLMYKIAKVVVKNFAEQPTLRAALENPVLNFDTKQKLMLSAAGKTINKVYNQFVEFLLTKNRESYLQLIMLKFIDLYREHHNIYAAKLITASKLDALTEKKLISVIESKKSGKLELNKFVDSDLIGGFILDVDNTRWDASVKRQLKTIKRDLKIR